MGDGNLVMTFRGPHFTKSQEHASKAIWLRAQGRFSGPGSPRKSLTYLRFDDPAFLAPPSWRSQQRAGKPGRNADCDKGPNDATGVEATALKGLGERLTQGTLYMRRAWNTGGKRNCT